MLSRGEIETTVSLVDLLPTLFALLRRGVFSLGTRGRNHKAYTRHDGKKRILAFPERRGAFIAASPAWWGCTTSERTRGEDTRRALRALGYLEPEPAP